jgi:hypothetical protein
MHDYIEISQDFQYLDTNIYRVFDHQWEAEILHWFGSKYIPKEKKEELIQALIGFEGECGYFYHYRAYLFAAKALAYFPESRLGDKIVEQVLKWGYAYFRQDKQDWKIYPQPLVDAARKVIPKTDQKRVVAAYIQLLHHTESRSILRVAATHLAKLVPENRTAIAALILLLKFSPNQNVSYQLIPILEEVGCGHEMVITCLIELMQTTLDKELCIRTIQAVGRIGNGKVAAIRGLIDFLQINQGDAICIYAVESLWQIDPDNTLIIGTLLNLLDSHRGFNIIWLASELIAKISPGNSQAIAILLERIRTSEDMSILWNITECLAKIAPGNSQAIAILLNRMQTSETEQYRYLFAANLIKIQPDNIEAINTLSEMLENSQDESLKHQIASVLIENNPDLVLARGYPDPRIALRIIDQSRLQIAEKLVQTKEHRQRGIALLFELSDFYVDYGYDSFPAITILKNIDPSHQLAIQALVKVIERKSDECEWVLRRELAKLEPNHKLVVEKIKQVIASVILAVKNWESQDNDEWENSLTPECYNYYFYKTYMQQDSDIWIKILQSHELQQIVIALKEYVIGNCAKKDYELHDIADNIIWCCAQNLTYWEFYQAWHS